MAPTMNDVYGDDSNHDCCVACGFCVTCGDCQSYGCGSAEADVEAMRTKWVKVQGLKKRPDQGGITNETD